jgi:N-acetylglucosaminyldiphosphoundecaprenol N-acetyl-beta-D-mannosaminyltransferase
VNAADLVTPDGMPLVWALKAFGIGDASRVYGPDLTLVVCEHAAAHDVPVGFYGGSPAVLDDLVAALRHRVPGLRVCFAQSPPYRPLTAEEDEAAVQAMRRSGAGIVFVGLGAPKQESWMAEHRHRLPAVLVGVGAAFDFIAGHKRQAPRALQRAGLEWAFRLATEPRRLWRRYAERNPRFVVLFTRQLLLGDRYGRHEPGG